MKIVYTSFFKDENADSYFLNLSCLSLSITLSIKFGSRVEVRTNQKNRQIIERLFDGVEFIEQAEQPFGPHHWELNKVISYSKQSEPFVHLDHDVFISKNPEFEKLCNCDFFVQHEENELGQIDGLRSSYLFAKDNGHKFPPYVDEFAEGGNWTQYNMGAFGCWNLDDLSDYCNDAISSVNCNAVQFEKQPMLYEQFLFTAFSRKRQLSVSKLLDGDLQNSAKNIGYCHLQNGKRKLNESMGVIYSLKRNNIKAFELLSKAISESSLCRLANASDQFKLNKPCRLS